MGTKSSAFTFSWVHELSELDDLAEEAITLDGRRDAARGNQGGLDRDAGGRP